MRAMIVVALWVLVEICRVMGVMGSVMRVVVAVEMWVVMGVNGGAEIWVEVWDVLGMVAIGRRMGCWNPVGCWVCE